jgi:hypothetical protein
MTLTSEQLAQLARLVVDTEPEELDCNAVLDLLAGYLEASEKHCTLPPEFAPVRQHLRVCADCDEEFRALLAAYGL